MSLVTRFVIALPSIIAGLILVMLLLAAAFTDRRSMVGAILLAALGLVWLLANKPVEGETLLPLTQGNGVTTADLAGLTAMAIAVWRVWRNLRDRRSNRSRP